MESAAILTYDSAFLDALSARAISSRRLRQHHNIHTSFDDPCQRFLNALEPGTYLQPNRHARRPRAKLLAALRGAFAAVLFDGAGTVTRVAPFAAGATDGRALAVEIAPRVWNTVVSLEHASVLLEVKAGPFDPGEPAETAAWAPGPNEPTAAPYAEWLRQTVAAWAGVPVPAPNWL